MFHTSGPTPRAPLVLAQTQRGAVRMNKPVIAAVALLFAAGLGFWLLAGDNQSPPAPLVPDSTSPAPTVAPAPADSNTGSASAPSHAATPKGAAGTASAGADDGVPDGKPNLVGGVSEEPITPFVLPAMFHIPRGLDRAEAKPGESLTAAAMKQADMASLDPTDGAYDEVVETHQLFNPIEKDFLARGTVTADDWADMLKTHDSAKEAMLDRSVVLANGGHADESESMLLEWGALEHGYSEKVEN
jgi:hypothetical protein